MAKLKKKNNLGLLLLILLVSISVGYAAFAQSLNINGTATANGNFKLKFTNAVIAPNVGAEESTYFISPNGETLSVDMQLEYPGAGAKVTATITNTGSVAAKLKNVTITGDTDTDILVDVEHDALDSIIEPNQTKDVIITVQWNPESKNAKTLNFSATLDYEQSTTNYTETTTTSEPTNNG